MKKVLIFIFGLFLIVGFQTTSALAQAASGKDSEAYKRQLSIYQNALKFNDMSVAKNALYNLRALDPADNSLLDSLAYLYYDYQQHASSLLVTREILARNPNNLAALEINAVSFENLGLYDQALTAYESLYLKHDSPYTLYKIGLLQLDLKRHTESKTSLDILLKKPDIDSLNVVVNENNQQKQIPMRAALLNFQGINNLELGEKEAAKQNFEEALKLVPDYVMAKENLEKL